MNINSIGGVKRPPSIKIDKSSTDLPVNKINSGKSSGSGNGQELDVSSLSFFKSLPKSMAEKLLKGVSKD